MKIAVDIDDVLGDLNESLINFVKSNYSLNVEREDFTTYDLTEVFSCSQEEVDKRVLEYYATDLITKLEPLDGSEKVVSDLQKDHELIVITARSRFIEDKTNYWLEKYYPKFSKVFFSQSKIQKGKRKWEIAVDEKVDVIIDDAPHVILDAYKKGIFCILMDTPWNRHIKEKDTLIRVKNWFEIKSIIGDLI